MLSSFVEALMGADADAVCNAGYGVRSEERTNTGNGLRSAVTGSGRGEPIAHIGAKWDHRECVEFNRNKLLVSQARRTAGAARRRGVEASLLAVWESGDNA
jgi:hypothetical protein